MSQSWKNIFRDFSRNTQGNVAMLFAFSIIPLMGAGALAVDYTYAETMKTKLSIAADTAALSGAQVYGGTEAQRIARAQESFNASLAQMPGVTAVSFSAADVVTAGIKTGFKVEATANSETFFGRIYGKDHVVIGSRAEATLGDGNKLELAFVLDTTGSMSGSRLIALKAAANNLVDILDGKKLYAGQIKYGLVPFAEYVNVGISNRNKPWMSVPPDTSTPMNTCWDTYPNATSSNCRTETQYNDGIPYQANVCDWNYGAPVQQCGAWTSTSQWYGCVGSRNYPLDVQDGNYGTPVPGLMNTGCPGEIVPLTSNKTTIQTGINNMSAGGETYIPVGLTWGRSILSPNDPFSESDKGKTAQRVKQYLILMTDGMITRSADYPYHWGTNPMGPNGRGVADDLTREMCSKIKTEDEVTIFTIAFEVTNLGIKDTLQNCASHASNFFDASNAAQLSDAFTQIGASITALRLQK